MKEQKKLASTVVNQCSVEEEQLRRSIVIVDGVVNSRLKEMKLGLP